MLFPGISPISESTPDYKGFKEGFQQVPETLASFFKKAGGEIWLNTKITDFDWTSSGVRSQGGEQAVEAASLILAMPRRSLDLLALTSPPLKEIQELIARVTPRPLFKLFTTYSNPWWRAAGYTNTDGEFTPVEAGRTVTDLPARQTYYWPRDDGKPATEGPAPRSCRA